MVITDYYSYQGFIGRNFRQFRVCVMLFSTFYLDAWNVLQTMVTTIRYFLKLLLRATKIPASGLQLCTSWCY